MFDDCIRTHGQVVRPIQEGLYEVTLKNGKPVTAHLSKELKAASTVLNEGDQVILEMTTYDFDQARVAEVMARG